MILTEKEQKAMKAIAIAMGSIQEMDDRRSLFYNHEELASAIHVLQGFVKQHVLNRQDPKYWSDWWGDNDV